MEHVDNLKNMLEIKFEFGFIHFLCNHKTQEV